ncbi:hypothetical protein ELH88_28365 (plasmid) [Rhizobium ruizarguesonis]|jgi:hypothetical protein|uniref:hypothetical protein n=1 Tax=Rhizobium ruizarguesonis TaxID=2081791 RepID=UPI0010304001|nr:hypothetical protein [Rhizobium ruizarguesonis]TAY29953.1 hypothetical protein ELH87_36410 [Rhizobium ruizarguesonis]TAY44995.1 hypothetical protein ELH88_28365 [Rhizobium ruizarguesonis]
MSDITTGVDDAPKDATIAQSRPGLPDHSSQPVEATLRIRAKLGSTDDEERKDDADDLAKQLARPKHGTA